MPSARCPHCGETIEVVSSKDLYERYNITPNALQHAREKDAFPDAWLEFPKRNVWLKADIDAFASQRAEQRVEKSIEEMTKLLDGVELPEDRRKALLASFEHLRIINKTGPVKKKRR
jgi:hypothetical protein